MTLGEKFYEALGHLYYAIIKADKEVENDESITAIKFIRDFWSPLETKLDSKGENIALIAADTINRLNMQKVSSKEAFKYFKTFYQEHHKQFSHPIIDRIHKTCKKISEISHGVDKKEAKILQELDEIFEG
jgi:hypothetical protein